MKNLLFFLPVLMVVVVAPVSARTIGEIDVGGVLRDAVLNGLNVPSVKLSTFRGKPLLINVWASWCGPCRQEMGSLNRLSQRYGGKQLKVIGISTDDDVNAAFNFLERSGTSFENFIDKKLLMENMLGADRLPLTLLIDAQGKIVRKHYGAREWDDRESRDLISKNLGVVLP